MLALDANLVVEVCLERVGEEALSALGDEQLYAPWLLWSEVPAALSTMAFRKEISHDLAKTALERLHTLKVQPCHPDGLIDRAWQIASAYGWAKTYDAEYLALAQLLSCQLVTLDGPLWRRTRNLGFVITPTELEPPKQDPTEPRT